MLLVHEENSLPVFSGNFVFTVSYAFATESLTLTSIGTVTSLDDVTSLRSRAPLAVRQPANTFTPFLSNFWARRFPNPVSHPVIKTYFDVMSLICRRKTLARMTMTSVRKVTIDPTDTNTKSKIILWNLYWKMKETFINGKRKVGEESIRDKISWKIVHFLCKFDKDCIKKERRWHKKPSKLVSWSPLF